MNKIKTEHLTRLAYIYVRQSTPGQVMQHRESQRLQYHLVERAKELGWPEASIRVIDKDLGSSASGCVDRTGFNEILTGVCEDKAGAVFSMEASRLARNGREWHTLPEICGVKRTLLVDQEANYHLNLTEVKRQRELALEQARYETLRAKRQYHAVDPDNRLVAATLEKDWNDALTKVTQIEQEVNHLTQTQPSISENEKAEIKELAQDLPRVWHHRKSSPELKNVSCVKSLKKSLFM